MNTTLTLTGIAHGGEAFGQHEGKIVFVPYTIPGEVVEVEIVEEKARWARARLVDILEASPDRVEPPCPYFGPGKCSGCQWQHIGYERQLVLKAEVVADQLRRLGFIADPPVQDLIALADDTGLLDYGYRNRVQLLATAGGGLGYKRDNERQQAVKETGGTEAHESGTIGDVIPVDACLLLHPLLDEVHGALESGVLAVDDPDEEPGNAPEQPGDSETPPVVIREMGLRVGVNTGQRLIVFETERDRLPGFLVEGLPIRCALRERNGAVQTLIGEPWIEEIVAGRTFRVSAGSFFYSNTVGAQAMVELAVEMLAPQGHETLLDCYCGVGLFGISLAQQVGHVVGIEESEAACEDFAWNAQDLNNVTLHEGPIIDVLTSLDALQRIDMAVIDPPRSGAGPEVAFQLRRLAVRKLLYVSYDPATLARDAKLLVDAGYRLVKVQPLDLFPQTYHIESLALFSR